MSASSQLPGAPEVEALRAELRCILQHPAITPARRQAAELYIGRCTDGTRLRHWLALAVAECGRWEDQTLVREGANGATIGASCA
jgi:hypothetical protein